MINLITGLPGAGKTLYTIWYVKQLAEKEDRTVYYHGINDLKLPWVLLDEPEKWYELPPKSIIVLDECQRLFRLRSNSSNVPQHVSELETHRHSGYDLFLITQHPRLIDQNVRRLIGEHRNIVRAFGSQFSVVNKFIGVREDCDKPQKDALQEKFIYPKEVFDYYKSAEAHTQKRNIPARIYLLLLTPFLFIGLGYLGITYMKNIYGGNKNAEVVQASKSPTGENFNASAPSFNNSGASKVKTVEEYQAESFPRIPSLPQSAPKYDHLTVPTVAPVISACIKSAESCKCFTQQATPVSTSYEFCIDVVEKGYFVDYGPSGPAESGRAPARPITAGQAGPDDFKKPFSRERF